MHDDFLYTQAHEKLSKITSILEAEMDLLKKKHPVFYKQTNVYAYEKIANLEVRQRNFQAVISIHDFCESIVIMTDKLYSFYCLALMVTGKKDPFEAADAALKYVYSIDTSNSHLARLETNWNFFLVELRRMRKWDEALDLTNNFGSSKLFGSDFLHVATYIERYRVEAQKRPRDKRNWMSVSLYKYIFTKIGDGFAKIQTRDVCPHPYMILLYAQWLYLNHEGTAEQNFKEKDTAIFLVEEYIESNCEAEAMQICEHCLGCMQKSSTSNPLLVCSGCRVACYCNLDHQRSSWKKELHWGVGIGHKILCPLYKAYRKYKSARKSLGKNSDEYHSRFRRECEKFLSDGLGLKDLCFSEDFVDENDEEFRFVKWRVEFAAYRLREIQKSGSTKMAS